MNRFKFLLLSPIAFLCLCFPMKSTAQTAMESADSIVYNTAIYSELYNAYKIRANDISQEVIEAIAKVLVVWAGNLHINTKVLEDLNPNTRLDSDLNLDSLGVVNLMEQLEEELPFYNKEKGYVATSLRIIGDVVDVVKPSSDSTMLVMAYYPWKAVFDTHSVHRVGLYNDGIGILKGLIEYTNDSIQREVYINELMELYDVWYEYADTINAGMNEHYSKAVIKSEKAKDYIEMYPDEITEQNVMQYQYVKMYDYIMDALNEPEGQEEIYYLNVDKLMRISIQRLKRNWKEYQEQYVADFETFDVRMQLLLEHVTNPAAIGNINYLHAGHTDAFDQNSTNITASTGDCGAMEEAFAMQMWDKAMDEKFLSRVIRSMRGCPDSDVYLEALENYTYLSNVAPEDILAKRRLLVNVYLKRERYDEAIEQIRFLIGLKEGVDNIEKANYYYMWGYIMERQGNYQTAAFRYKSAVNLNPNFGNAYYRLAIMYSNSKNKFTNDQLKDSYRYLLCVDKLERAKECIQQYAGSATMGKYNNASLSDINQYIASFKSMCPDQAEAFMLGADFSTPGKKYTFPGGVMKGETTTIRFY